jgi:hypothetical protein
VLRTTHRNLSRHRPGAPQRIAGREQMAPLLSAFCGLRPVLVGRREWPLARGCSGGVIGTPELRARRGSSGSGGTWRLALKPNSREHRPTKFCPLRVKTGRDMRAALRRPCRPSAAGSRPRFSLERANYFQVPARLPLPSSGVWGATEHGSRHLAPSKQEARPGPSSCSELLLLLPFTTSCAVIQQGAGGRWGAYLNSPGCSLDPPPFASATKCHQKSSANSAGSSVGSLSPPPGHPTAGRCGRVVTVPPLLLCTRPARARPSIGGQSPPPAPR